MSGRTRFFVKISLLAGLASGFCTPVLAQQTQCVSNALAGGTVDAIRIPAQPCATSTNILILTAAGANTVANPTLQLAGGPVLPIQTSTGTNPGIGAIPGAGAVIMLTGTGSAWKIVSGNASTTFSGTLAVANGGTGATTFTSNGVLVGHTTGALTATSAGTTGTFLAGNTGSPPSFQALSGLAVTSLSFGSTGLTPSGATQGAISVAGTLGVGYGGTGQTSYTDGQLLIGNSSGNTLTKATLTAGANMVITNSGGGITLASTGVSSGCGTIGTSGQVLLDNGSGGCSSSSAVSVSSSNLLGTAQIRSGSGTAIPAGGSTAFGHTATSTSNFGLFFGSGAPSLSAAQGSLYLRSDGTPYYNTDGTTGWSQIAVGQITAIQSKTSNFNAVSNESYCVDTSGGAVTATLPGSPLNNDTIPFVACSNYSSNNLIISRNGNNIQGLAENMTVSTNNAAFSLTFVTSYGWRLN